MLAELIVDLPSLGNAIGKAAGRNARLFPGLANLAQMWASLGVEVERFHLVTPGQSHEAGEARFSELHTRAWWEAEQVFVADEDFSVEFHHYPQEVSNIAHDAMVVTTALARSDALAAGDADSEFVIVMSDSPHVAPAVTHASGAAVMLASTVVPDPGLSHIRLQPEWFAELHMRFATIALPDVNLVNGRPRRHGAAIATPFGGFEGRRSWLTKMSKFAKSVALYDPDRFSIISSGESQPAHATPDPVGIAATVQLLGMGELVHVEVVDPTDPHVDVSIVATMYRFAADYPDVPISIVSTRDSIIAATSDLNAFSIHNPRRLLRLCVPQREQTFDESVFTGAVSAARVVLEHSQSEALFNGELEGGAGEVQLSGSPVLTLWSNPNHAKEATADWRDKTQRRFLMMGSDGTEATPADSAEGPVLPVALGGCTDFDARRPVFRAGSIAEGVRSSDGTRWVIVSDPIERRQHRRSDPSEDADTTDDYSEAAAHAA